MRRFLPRLNLLAVPLALTLLLSACVQTNTAAPFIPPAAGPAPTVTSTATPVSAPVALPTFTLAPPTASPAPSDTPIPTSNICTDNLTFVQDITVTDGTIVQPGATIEKQWLVTNSGTCNWDASYRLKFVSGDTLGAPAEQALFPARAGAQATLKITFIAPQEMGTYQSAWQAFAPNGSAFGDPVYMTIVVSQ
jgi:hypothetical protein